MLADALAALAFGPVLPLHPEKRTPLTAFANAALTEDGVRSLWRMNDNAGVGVVAGPAHLLVIDVEGPTKGDGAPTLRELELMFGRLPRTRRHRTKSDGFHLVFSTAALLRSAQRLIRHHNIAAPGIDVVAGHAVLRWAPGVAGYTLDDDAPIAVLPESWATALGEAPKRAETTRGHGPNRHYALAALRSEANELAATSALRNPRLTRAAFALGGLVPAISEDEIVSTLLIACEENGSLKEHGERNCRSTIARAMRAGASRPRSVS